MLNKVFICNGCQQVFACEMLVLARNMLLNNVTQCQQCARAGGQCQPMAQYNSGHVHYAWCADCLKRAGVKKVQTLSLCRQCGMVFKCNQGGIVQYCRQCGKETCFTRYVWQVQNVQFGVCDLCIESRRVYHDVYP